MSTVRHGQDRLVQREHRALHDLIAGSCVIYAWDARAARLGFLAREAEASRNGSSPALAPPPPAPGQTDGGSV